jgi:hypothetical protein
MNTPLRVADRRDGLHIWKMLQVKQQWRKRISDQKWGKYFNYKKKIQTLIHCLELTFLTFEIDENIFLYVFLRFVTNIYHLIFNLIEETCNPLLISGYKILKTFFAFILFKCVRRFEIMFPKKRYFGRPKLYVSAKSNYLTHLIKF